MTARQQEQKADIIKKAVDLMRLRRMALSTERTYVQWIGSYIELARKYPKAPFAWQWSWLFPSHQPCNHPRTGERVRYRMHEANVQRAVKLAARTLELDSFVTPHVLRHCCATHILEAGGNVRDLQEFLGHAHLETTQGYIHPEAMRVISPLA